MPSMKKLISFLLLLSTVACNPELKQLGSGEDDLVKYFQVSQKEGVSSLGEGYLIVAHVGEKRILTIYLKTSTGYSHTDVTLMAGDGSYVVDSVYSQTPDCKLAPDFKQSEYLQYLNIEGSQKSLNLIELNREEAMKTVKKLGC